MKRRAALRELRAWLRAASPDERAVLLFVARRLAHGRRQYGPLDLARDTRDWALELGEEAADALVYAACRAVRARARGAS